MIVGALEIRLRLAENQSLKGKRHVVRSIIEKVRGRYNVAAAEVDSQDLWQLADLGFSCVSNSVSHAEAMLTEVVRYVEESRPDVEIVDVSTETFPLQ